MCQVAPGSLCVSAFHTADKVNFYLVYASIQTANPAPISMVMPVTDIPCAKKYPEENINAFAITWNAIETYLFFAFLFVI
jgi:hypothetical protein